MGVWSPRARPRDPCSCRRSTTTFLGLSWFAGMPPSWAVCEHPTFSAGHRMLLVHRLSGNRLRWGGERNTDQSVR